jgi:hypothetical protein
MPLRGGQMPCLQAHKACNAVIEANSIHTTCPTNILQGFDNDKHQNLSCLTRL